MSSGCLAQAAQRLLCHVCVKIKQLLSLLVGDDELLLHEIGLKPSSFWERSGASDCLGSIKDRFRVGDRITERHCGDCFGAGLARDENFFEDLRAVLRTCVRLS